MSLKIKRLLCVFSCLNNLEKHGDLSEIVLPLFFENLFGPFFSRSSGYPNVTNIVFSRKMKNSERIELREIQCDQNVVENKRITDHGSSCVAMETDFGCLGDDGQRSGEEFDDVIMNPHRCTAGISHLNVLFIEELFLEMKKSLHQRSSTKI